MPRTARRRLAAVLLPVAVLLAGCLQGEGPVIDETREMPAFDRIDAGGGIRVEVSIGSAQPIEVRAQANILPSIDTGVNNNGTLRIEPTDDFTVAEPVTVVVVLPSLAAITLSGGAQASIESLHAEAFEAVLSGGSTATISGVAGTVTLSGRGGAEADLRDLAAESAEVSLDGGSTATLQASEVVTGTASGGAVLTLFGDPRVEVRTSGGAQVLGE
jgi:hypothetical protein